MLISYMFDDERIGKIKNNINNQNSSQDDHSQDSVDINLLPVQVAVVIGHKYMLISDLAKLGRGSLIELSTKVSDPVIIYVNGVALAKGEVVVDSNEAVKILIINMVDKDEPYLYHR